MSDNHTPIPHLINDVTTTVATDDAQTSNPPAAPINPRPQASKIDPISVGSSKEAGPAILRTEAAPEQHAEDEQTSEQQEVQEKKHEVKHKKEVPDIHPDAVAVGVQVAPSASPFPTIYDIKVPVLKDEEIEKGLHSNFWSGARWLAEVCKYMLWQAHIRLKKVGNKVVRERVNQPF